MPLGSPVRRAGSRDWSFSNTPGRRTAGERISRQPALRSESGTSLLAEPERVDQVPVAVEVLPLQVVEKSAALTDDLQQAPTRVVILLVGLEVLGQVVDP